MKIHELFDICRSLLLPSLFKSNPSFLWLVKTFLVMLLLFSGRPSGPFSVADGGGGGGNVTEPPNVVGRVGDVELGRLSLAGLYERILHLSIYIYVLYLPDR